MQMLTDSPLSEASPLFFASTHWSFTKRRADIIDFSHALFWSGLVSSG